METTTTTAEDLVSDGSPISYIILKESLHNILPYSLLTPSKVLTVKIPKPSNWAPVCCLPGELSSSLRELKHSSPGLPRVCNSRNTNYRSNTVIERVAIVVIVVLVGL